MYILYVYPDQWDVSNHIKSIGNIDSSEHNQNVMPIVHPSNLGIFLTKICIFCLGIRPQNAEKSIMPRTQIFNCSNDQLSKQTFVTGTKIHATALRQTASNFSWR